MSLRNHSSGYTRYIHHAGISAFPVSYIHHAGTAFPVSYIHHAGTAFHSTRIRRRNRGVSDAGTTSVPTPELGFCFLRLGFFTMASRSSQVRGSQRALTSPHPS